MTTTPTPASQPSLAQIEKLARAAVATYDDPHLSAVAVERAIGMLRKELGEPSPARSDKDAERAPYKALGASVFGPSGRLFCNTESEERAARLATKLNDESGRTPAGQAQESAPSSEGIDFDKLGALARAAEKMFTGMHWYTRFQILDGISNDESAAFIGALDPDTVLGLIALARRATAGTTAAQSERCAVLEEAAQTCEARVIDPVSSQHDEAHNMTARRCASSIRSLKGATAGNAAPTYQISIDHTLATWADVSREEFDAHTNTTWRKKRVVYLATPAATAAPNVMDDRRAFHEWFNGTMYRPDAEEAMLIGWQASTAYRSAATAAPGDMPQVGAYAWFHRGMVNFDAEDVLATLDDNKGTPIPLYLASNAGAAIPEHLREFVKEIADEYTYYDPQESVCCMGCGADLDDKHPHKPDCIVLRAQALIAPSSAVGAKEGDK